MSMPFCDLKAGYDAHKQELDAAAARVLNSGWHILGPECGAFEEEYAKWNDAAHCIGVANGTDAVELALRGVGVEAGDKAATVSHTAVATVAAIERMGAIPVFVDIDERRFTMSPASLARVLEAHKIKAVLPVHLYGQCADMDAISALAREHGCLVVEDCAQAHGSLLNGRKAGTFGDAASFSFYPTKNLGAFGDGGAVLTNNQAVAGKVQSLRQYGWEKRYISSIQGFNSRLDELQAAFLRARLKYLDAENNRRRQLAAMYVDRLGHIGGLTMPFTAPDCSPVWHQFVIMTETGKRDDFIKSLAGGGIPTAIHYPLPVHMQPAYAGRIAADPVGLAATEAICQRIVSLPMYAAMPEENLEKICAAIDNYYSNGGKGK